MCAKKDAVNGVFARLPQVFQTNAVKAEITRSVARSKGNYEAAALRSVIGVLTSIDRALKRQKPFKLK